MKSYIVYFYHMAKFSVSYNGKSSRPYELEDCRYYNWTVAGEQNLHFKHGDSRRHAKWKETETKFFAYRFQLFKWHICQQ